MGQKNSSVSMRKKMGGKDTVVSKAAGSKLSIQQRSALDGGPDSTSGGHSFLTIAPVGEEDISVGAMDERDMYIVPRRSANICGMFLETLVITAPIDDPMDRDLGIYELFNYDTSEERMWAYIARPEVKKQDAKESFTAMYQILAREQPADSAMQFSYATSPNLPTLVVAGRLKRLFFGAESFQQGEHDPEWRGRLAMIVSIPSNGVFISALLALSPTGTIPLWFALVVGLGLVRALGSLHELGYIHRYVTPWNFLLLTPFSIDNIVNKTICIDMSLATKWQEKRSMGVTGGGVQFVGTIKYSSKRAITRHKQGPADDFISAIYIVAELISGKLPWRAIKDMEDCAIYKQKFQESIQFRRLPHEIRKIYQILYRTYGIKKPNYNQVVEAFEKALERKMEGWAIQDLPVYLTMPLE